MADQLSKADPRVHILRCANAGHAVLGLPLPPDDPRTADLASLGGTPAGNEEARLDALPEVIDFPTKAFWEH